MGFRVWGVGFRVRALGFGVLGFGFGVLGSGFWVEGWGAGSVCYGSMLRTISVYNQNPITSKPSRMECHVPKGPCSYNYRHRYILRDLLWGVEGLGFVGFLFGSAENKDYKILTNTTSHASLLSTPDRISLN